MPARETALVPHPLFDAARRCDDQRRVLRYPTLVRFIEGLTIGTAMREHQWIHEFLSGYQRVKGTFNLYRTESQRLLLYLWLVETVSLSQINSEILTRYLRWRQDPPIGWIASHNAWAFRWNGIAFEANPAWRPFVHRQNSTCHSSPSPESTTYCMAPGTFDVTCASLHTICCWLVMRGILSQNPMATLRSNGRRLNPGFLQRAPGKDQALTCDDWSVFLTTLMSLANDNPVIERELFIVVTMEKLQLHVSELAVWPVAGGEDRVPTFGSCIKQPTHRSGQWLFCVTGRADVYREIAIPDDYFPFLRRYRCYRGLSPLPSPREAIPLLTSRAGKPLRRRQVTRLIEQAFCRVADRLERNTHRSDCQHTDHGKLLALAALLREISTKTNALRHTGATQKLSASDLHDVPAISRELGFSEPGALINAYVDGQTKGRKKRS